MDRIEHEVYGDFGTLGGDEPAWVPGGFAAPDGAFVRFIEPGAVAIVRNGRLRVTIPELTRRHDTEQILDNVKHMMFSARPLPVPPAGGIAVELTMRSACAGTDPGDLYDGFASFSLIDIGRGVALDWFCGHDRIAPVAARLPFPGAQPPGDDDAVPYFALFDEHEHVPGEPRRVRISYDRPLGRVRWWLDDALVWDRPSPAPLDGFLAALGIMTERDLGPRGSISCHGQGVTGEWSPLEVTTWHGADARPAALWEAGR